MSKNTSLNFGSIRDSIVRMSNHEITNGSDSNTLKEFTKKLKESSTLKKQYLVYQNFEKCKPFQKQTLAERFINQNMSIFSKGDWESIMNENREVRIGLMENSHVNSSRNDDLFENIHTLIEARAKPGFYDFEREQLAYDELVEFLTRSEELLSEEKSEEPDLVSWKFFTKAALNKFDKRYAHLSESDREVFNTLCSTNDQKKVFLEGIKSEILNSIKDIDEPTINEVREKVSKISDEKLDDSIIAIYEIKQVLQEIS